MLNFVSKVFENFLEIILWLELIVCAVIGAVIGGFTGGGGYALLGLILGTAVGLIYNVIFGGVLVIFVKMGKEISELKGEVKKISSGHNANNNAHTAENSWS